MNAKEAMQALLTGKIVYRQCKGDINKFKLSDDGTLDWCTSDGGWEPISWMLNSIEGIYEEYPLAFEQALKEMLNGKTVMCEVFNDRKYHFSDGWFRFQYHDDDWAQADWFEMRMRDAKWKVVE